MRYLPLSTDDRRLMLARVGVKSIDDLFADFPAEKRPIELAALPLHQSELAVERHLGAMAGKNVAAGAVPFFLGAGA